MADSSHVTADEQNTCEPFRCRQTSCHFVGKSWPALRSHLINGHKMRANTTTGEVKAEKKAPLACRHLNCAFVGKSAIALRSHVINGHRFGKRRKRLTERPKRRREAREAEKNEIKCLFPKCGQQFASERALREHIQAAHKQRRKCYFEKCHFETSDVTALRLHLLSHPTPVPVVAPPPPPLLKCGQNGCRFGSQTVKGLRIHAKKNHSSSSCVIQTQLMVGSDSRSRVMVFRCSECEYFSENILELRKHLEMH